MIRQHIINRRKALGLTQKQISNDVGISRSSYAAIERGLRCPSLDTAQRICKAIGMSVNEAFPID